MAYLKPTSCVFVRGRQVSDFISIFDPDPNAEYGLDLVPHIKTKMAQWKALPSRPLADPHARLHCTC